MLKKYVAIVGDVIRSGKIKERKKYWKKLNRAIEKVNEKYKEEIFANFMILKGDEISGVLKDLEMVYEILREIQENFLPYQMRFVAVYDELDIALETKNASLIDGMAFRKAGDYLQEIKKRRQRRLKTKKDFYFDYFYFDLGNKAIDREINILANLVAILKYTKWKKERKKVIELFEEIGNQTEVSKKLNVTQQDVSDALKNACWKEVREAEKLINEKLITYKRKT